MQINKIKSSLFALSLLTSAGAWAQSTFTPVTTLTEGWYQIKLTTGTGVTEATTAISNNKNYLCVANSEIKRSFGSYIVKLDAVTSDNEARSYFYVKPSTSNSGYYSLQTINGHYIGAESTAYTSGETIKGQVQLTLSTDAFSWKTQKISQPDSVNAIPFTAETTFTESPYMGASSSSGGSVRYQFSKIENPEANLKAYTVTITGAPEGSSPCFNATVTCNSEKSKGITTVYNGGRFFVSKDATLTESDLTPLAIYGYGASVSVDESNKSIQVKYVNVLADGSVVRILNVQKSGSRWPLYFDSSNGLKVDNTNGTAHNQSDYFIVKADGDKYAFVSAKTGEYLSYRGNGSKTNGNVNTYDNNTSAFTITRAVAPTSFPYSSDYPYNSFYFYSTKRSTTDNAVGCFVVKSTGAFDGYGASVGYADAYSNLFVLEPVTDYNYQNVNLQAKNDKNYASVYLPYSFTLPEGVEAYYGRALNDDQSQITLSPISGNTVPKATAVVLVSNSVSGAQTLAPALNTTEPTAITDNKLHGTIEPTNVDNGQTIYGFTGKYDEIGFYKWTGTQLPLGKAYLSVNTPQAAAAGFVLNFDDNEITGIDTATTIQPTKSNAVCYDLYGRRISQPTKGIFIMNGKKVIR